MARLILRRQAWVKSPCPSCYTLHARGRVFTAGGYCRSCRGGWGVGGEGRGRDGGGGIWECVICCFVFFLVGYIFYIIILLIYCFLFYYCYFLCEGSLFSDISFFIFSFRFRTSLVFVCISFYQSIFVSLKDAYFLHSLSFFLFSFH